MQSRCNKFITELKRKVKPIIIEFKKIDYISNLDSNIELIRKVCKNSKAEVIDTKHKDGLIIFTLQPTAGKAN